VRIRLSRRRGQAEARYPFSAWVVAWHRDRESGELQVTLHVIRVLLIGAVVAAAGWVAASVTAWSLMQKRGYRSIAWADVALPWRWTEIRRKQGADLVARGLTAAKNGETDAAMRELALGLQRAPSREGRQVLGALLAGALRESEAVACLTAGLGEFAPDRPYLELLFSQCAASDDLETARRTARQYWQAGWGAGRTGDHEWLAAQLGSILLQMERWDEALAWARELGAAKEHPCISWTWRRWRSPGPAVTARRSICCSGSRRNTPGATRGSWP
jgi:hypothetical protein